jgi:hypothetical protein
MLAPEMANPAPGSKLVVQHLADILFVHVCVLLAQLSSESFIWRPANFGDELYGREATSIWARGAGLSAAVLSVPNGELWNQWRSSKSRSRAFNNYKPGGSHQTRVDKQMSNPSFNDTVAKMILSGHIDALEKLWKAS